MDFNRAEPTSYKTNFSYASSSYPKWSFFVHSTTSNVLYVHQRLDLILKLCQAYPIEIQLTPRTPLTVNENAEKINELLQRKMIKLSRDQERVVTSYVIS